LKAERKMTLWAGVGPTAHAAFCVVKLKRFSQFKLYIRPVLELRAPNLRCVTSYSAGVHACVFLFFRYANSERYPQKAVTIYLLSPCSDDIYSFC
jgi:hypothetical protein